MRKTLRAVSIAAPLLLLMTIGSSSAVAAPQPALASARLSLGRIPLFFEKNVGQAAEPVKFLSRAPGYTLFLTGAESVMTLHRTEAAPSVRTTGPLQRAAECRNGKMITASVRLLLAGANPAALITGEDEQSGKSNYFIGNNPAKWRTSIANYGRVRYQGIYPGVDLVYYGTEQCLEHDFIVQPGAAVSEIRLRIDGGSKGVKLDGAGNLKIGTAAGIITLSRPEAYQVNNGRRERVDGGFVRRGNQEIAFAVGQYDHHRPLIIDPLIYSTYLGGSASTNVGDQALAIAVDAEGSAYVAGQAFSLNFPTTPGAFQTLNKSRGGTSAFVSKLNASGTGLVYSTYLGGSYAGVDDGAHGIALDSDGNAYVAGQTSSTDFPTTPGAFQTINRGATCAFITKLNSSGTGLIYSTFLGGRDFQSASSIAIDSGRNIYVVGQSNSSDFPVTPGAFQTVNEAGPIRQTGFVTKLNAAGTGLVYSTFLGGSSGFDEAGAVAVDSGGNAYVAGLTFSTDFPTTPGAFQTVDRDTSNKHTTYVAKLNAGGTQLIYSTYLGGNSGAGDYPQGIAVDTSGNAYVTGTSYSADFPTTSGAFQIVNTAAADNTSNAFVTKLNASGTGLVYSTFLGGSGGGYGDFARGIAVDSGGNAYVTGYANSSDFPITSDAFQTVNQIATENSSNAFVTQLNAGGTALIYSTYLGGSGNQFSGGDMGNAIALDMSGNVYFAGEANSPDFPTTPGAFQTNNPATLSGGFTGFVAKLSTGPSGAPSVLHIFNGQGWHLISSPYIIAQGFAALSVTAFAYDSADQNYVVTNTPPADTFHIGVGYWIYVKGGPLGIPGTVSDANSAQPFTLPLTRGWNLVGEPFTTGEPLSSISVKETSGVSVPFPTAVDSGFISGFYVYDFPLQTYNLRHYAADHLNPWDGAWIYSRQAGEQLVFNNPGAR